MTSIFRLDKRFQIAVGFRDCICHHFLAHVQQFHATVTVGNQIRNLLLTMKKVEIPYLRHLKYREKVGGKCSVSSQIVVQVLGSGGRGGPKSVLLTTDHSKYLFNCGEGTQRIASEFKMRLSKLENIFITHKSWDNIGGLLGMCLTLESMKVPRIIMHGPPGVENVALMAKGFAESTSMTLEKKELGDGNFKDSAFMIDYVPFYKKNFNPKQALQDTELDGTKGNAQKRLKAAPVENAIAVAYICRPYPALRKIMLEKCIDLGVEQGPLVGKLKNGESITLPNGNMVHPEQVLSKEEVAHPIIIVECPSKDYLDSLLQCDQFGSHQGCGEADPNKPSMVIHMTPLEVYRCQEYQDWMSKFGMYTEHLVLNELTSDVMLESVYRYQTWLHLVHPTIFPDLQHLSLDNDQCDCTKPSMPQEIFETKQLNGMTDQNVSSVVIACANLHFQYRPYKGFIWEHCVRLDHKAYKTKALSEKNLSSALEELQLELSKYSSNMPSDIEQDQVSGKYPHFVFLGTGSSVPSKGRNVSSLLVHLRKDATLVLDCGEGTSGQLYRHYGPQTQDILRNLKAIFVSHMHSDHHMGLFSLLQNRKVALESAGQELTPILLLAPIQIGRWLNFYHNHVEPVRHLFRHIPLQNLLPHMLELENNRVVYSDVLERLTLTEFRPVEVDHCPNAFGLVVTHTDGWKLVFSGDTVPCERLVKAGKNCDVLIHEATHEDDLEEEANRKRHSTTSQAIGVGQRMEAKFILLNHFSQRYAKIPFFGSHFPSNVGIAFDNMSVNMSELKLLPLLLPALKILFAEEHAELEATTLKRNRRKEFQFKYKGALSS